jgi:5'(3')-deoxyribonucleotidase
MLTGENLKYQDVKAFDYDKIFKHDSLRYPELFLRYPKNIFEDAKPYEKNVSEIIENFQKNNYTIHIVTHQFKGLEKYTINWLYKHKIPYDYITFAKDKNVVKGDYLIDDRLKNGSEKFKGKFIHFGTKKFPDWETVIAFLNKQ